MKIVCVGGGPAGLTFAMLARLCLPDAKVTVLERNPLGAKYGWGVVFPNSLPHPFASMDPATLKAQFDSGILDVFARHPSQLYQATLEGLVMFCVLAWYSRKPRPRHAVSGLFAMLYGSFRFLVEFVREPDAQIGYLAFGWLTMGQVLSLPLIALGLYWLLLWSRRQPTLEPQPFVAPAK